MERSALKNIRSHKNVSIHPSMPPQLGAIADKLIFSPEDGRIWFGDQRLVLWECSALGALRRELIASVGQEQARSILTRVAYSSGFHNAEKIMKINSGRDIAETFALGAQTLRIAGLIRPHSESSEFDIETGKFFSELILKDSHEADEHISAFGIGTETSCWMQVGYASGYASAFMGKRIVYRELDCRTRGAEYCRFVGKPADEWDDIEQDLHYFQPDASAKQIRQNYVMSKSKLNNQSVVIKDTIVQEPISPTQNLIGISTAFSTARHLIERVAPTKATVLFIGASGVGKERFAQTLHKISLRANDPFIAINCAAIPDTLIESELFGVERGAFTGASISRPGRFERAERGTLFLDEIASLSFVAQGKLLRALQERKIERVGGTTLIPVDVRVIAATNVDLRDEVAAGRFREDLFFRLNVFPISLPPLKERRDDIPLLMEAFLKQFCHLYQRKIPGFTSQALKTLLNYDFPGNVRELENLIERAVIMVDPDHPIDIHHLFRGGEITNKTNTFSLGENGRLNEESITPQKNNQALDEFSQIGVEYSPIKSEADVYKDALISARYNVTKAARKIGLTRAQFAYRIKRYKLI